MYPSSLRMRAISVLIREAGTRVVLCLLRTALRSLVSMSAMGSVIMTSLSSPARLDDPGDFALQGQLAEAETAQREAPQIAAGRPAETAPVAVPDPVLRFRHRLVDLRGGGHV